MLDISSYWNQSPTGQELIRLGIALTEFYNTYLCEEFVSTHSYEECMEVLAIAKQLEQKFHDSERKLLTRCDDDYLQEQRAECLEKLQRSQAENHQDAELWKSRLEDVARRTPQTAKAQLTTTWQGHSRTPATSQQKGKAYAKGTRDSLRMLACVSFMEKQKAILVLS